jgi:hypothetical protein
MLRYTYISFGVFRVSVIRSREPPCEYGRGCIFFISALHYCCTLIVQPDTRTINVLRVRRKCYQVLSLCVATITVLVGCWFVLRCLSCIVGTESNGGMNHAMHILSCCLGTLQGGPRKTTQILCHEKGPPNRYFNPGDFPEYKAGMPTAKPWRLILRYDLPIKICSYVIYTVDAVREETRPHSCCMCVHRKSFRTCWPGALGSLVGMPIALWARQFWAVFPR